jgi:predicted nucleic acid-binding protein
MAGRKSPVVVVDADAIVAQAYPDDTNHALAMKVSKKLIELGARVIYPASAVLEATTVLQARLNSGATAYGTAEVLVESQVHVAEVDQKILVGALAYFEPMGSKKDTLFDCVVMAVADEYSADAIFSFDKLYEKRGYRLASRLA